MDYIAQEITSYKFWSWILNGVLKSIALQVQIYTGLFPIALEVSMQAL